MRVLITNSRLDRRGGAEHFVRDLARGLQSLGHSVLAYTSDPSNRRRLMENDVLAVSTDPEHLPFMPDVIHAQHHLDAMTALCALPGVPAVYHCHGALWRECAPNHPRIYRYVAVSRTLRERMAIESNIDPSTITVLLNGVDLDRFCTVRTPQARLARALFFNQRHREGSETVDAIRAAASQCGLTLDFSGWPFGERILRPEETLPGYDVVFASGRSAIEAMACGCAVVVVGRTSCGELVRSGNFDRLRQVNFSIAVNSPPPSVDKIVAQLERFSAEDCRAVTERLRQEADLRLSVDALVRLYEEVITQHRHAEPDLRSEVLATSRYLRTVVPLINMTDHMLGGYWTSPARADSFDELRAQVALFQQRLEKAP